MKFGAIIANPDAWGLEVSPDPWVFFNKPLVLKVYSDKLAEIDDNDSLDVKLG